MNKPGKGYRPIEIAMGGAHSAMILGSQNWDHETTPTQKREQSLLNPNVLITFGNNELGQCGVDKDREIFSC